MPQTETIQVNFGEIEVKVKDYNHGELHVTYHPNSEDMDTMVLTVDEARKLRRALKRAYRKIEGD